ncbi:MULTISPECIES: hypothetical protein [Mycobacteroides]|uniref:hypothetical protein n=1 Tax=Mycobacteroides TaxID=670516 RepID=UPI00071474D7|nr:MULTISPECIES: hypothetical protein [Mycobacteroides]KRQ24567.1 hypothetical protein AOT91_22160 [Mycobacteroides sp. H092]KRQ26044.1 hypothetical protein AOT87_07825 [Mycobacteroides sp. H003]KRQ39372.1 hypothetical protein AOT92_19015 [Mycobacteroides sp. H101]KRQ48749.1 hypothetical protein AOT88_13825 [Mycobacteroides sp. H063]KRQ58486.1 hypothetical protein AOT90_24230 [Mycobacteroides sp. H079]
MIPIPIVVPSGSSGEGRDPAASDLAIASLVFSAVTGLFMALRWLVRTRTSEFLCALEYDDPRRVGCDRFGMSSYDMIHDFSAVLGWTAFVFAFGIGLLAGPFLASRQWLRTSRGLAFALYAAIGALALIIPTPGPEYLDPIRYAMLVLWGLSVIAYSVMGLRAAARIAKDLNQEAESGEGHPGAQES